MFFLSFLLLNSFQRTRYLTFCQVGGDEENRTPDPLLARQVLSQLSYTPTYVFFLDFRPFLSSLKKKLVGLTRLELVTSRLSGVRSNQLSYRPVSESFGSLKTKQYSFSDVRPHALEFLQGMSP